MTENTQQLTIQDLALIKNLIDMACSRGAFKASEMKPAGEVYDKLSAFLSAVLEQAEAAQAEAQSIQPTQQGEANA